MAPQTRLKAVIFDIGGVVARSPFSAIAAYERERGLPPLYLSVSIVGHGDQSAWAKLERGELGLFEFYERFERELRDTDHANAWYEAYCRKKGIPCPRLPKKFDVDGRELFGQMVREARALDERMVEAIKIIKASGKYKVIALTNNFGKIQNEPGLPRSEIEFLGGGRDGTLLPPSLKALFDDFLDSSEVGLRKPDPEFYKLACERNGVSPSEAVFLDDIGQNLKPAKQLGMQTIHVPLGGTLESLRKLQEMVGVDLRLGPGSAGKGKL